MYTIKHSDAIEMIELMQLMEIPFSSFGEKKRQFKMDFKKIKLDKCPTQRWLLIMVLNNDYFLINLTLLPTNKIRQRRSTGWE